MPRRKDQESSKMSRNTGMYEKEVISEGLSWERQGHRGVDVKEGAKLRR